MTSLPRRSRAALARPVCSFTALTGIRDLAALYVALIGQLEDVTVIGNSVGGWIAAEMALLASPRVSGAILVDAVGIEVPGHPIADFFSLTMDQVFTLSFHNPAPFRIDPATLPPAAQAIAAGNRATLAAYAGAADERPYPGRTARPPRATHPGAVGRQRPDRRPRLRPRLRRRHPTRPLPSPQRHRGAGMARTAGMLRPSAPGANFGAR
ncbi:MAG TPA: alpha/beta hydrolase [Streptosporangiaceae bacterium]